MPSDTASTGSVLGNMQRAAEGPAPAAAEKPDEQPADVSDAPAPPELPTTPEASAEPLQQDAPDQPEPDFFDLAASLLGKPEASLRQQYANDPGKLLQSSLHALRKVGEHSEELKAYRDLQEKLGEEGIAAIHAGKKPAEAPAESDSPPTWREYRLLQERVAAAQQNGGEVPADLQREYNRVVETVLRPQFELAAQYPKLQKLLEEFEAGKLGGGLSADVLDQRMAAAEHQRAILAWAERHRAQFYDDAGKPTSFGNAVGQEAYKLWYSQQRYSGKSPEQIDPAQYHPHELPVEMWEDATANVRSRQQPPKPSPKTGEAATRKPDAAPPDKVPETASEWFKKYKGKQGLKDYFTKGPGAKQQT